MIDPILSTLTLDQLQLVEASMSNDENSSDDELRDYFVSEAGLTEEQAAKALTYRTDYRLNIFLTGWTPILQGDNAICFDPMKGGFDHWKK